jgi:hypothetical protein
MSWYRIGTVTVTNGSPNVVGAGTAWFLTVRQSDGFIGPDGRVYEVLNVSADGAMVLATNYLGPSASGQSYGIQPTQSRIRELVAASEQIVADAESNLGTFQSISAVSDPGVGGMWPDINPAARIIRLRDRLFMGAAAASTGVRYNVQGGPVSGPSNGADWAIRDAQFLSFAQQGNLAVVGFSRSGDMDPLEQNASIGVAGFAIGNNPTKTAFALYGDLQFESGTFGYGLELAIKNKSGVSFQTHAHNAIYKVVGIWMPAGGDPSYGGSGNAPCDVAIAIGGLNAVGRQWNTGLVFFNNSLVRTGGATGRASAIEMAEDHEIVWRNGSGRAFTIRGSNATGAAGITLETTDSLVAFKGFAEANIVLFRHAASAVNHTRFTSASAGNLVTWEALGADPNVGIQIRTQGSQAVRFQSQGLSSTDEFRIGGINSNPVNFLHAYGTNSGQASAVLAAAGADATIDVLLVPKSAAGRVRFGAFSSSSDAPITGFIEIRDASGGTRKLATIA